MDGNFCFLMLVKKRSFFPTETLSRYFLRRLKRTMRSFSVIPTSSSFPLWLVQQSFERFHHAFGRRLLFFQRIDAFCNIAALLPQGPMHSAPKNSQVR
ncbi:hypothetical protein [uncultured Roseobacter sp.]|uniref:hypothetical protein n=1 Tax=uncultured Roseobacter sp. TaxID=114847 RepID=UPI002609EB23|nr:hypothetical protein [uncultured Roseobacter sp.]